MYKDIHTIIYSYQLIIISLNRICLSSIWYICMYVCTSWRMAPPLAPRPVVLLFVFLFAHKHRCVAYAIFFRNDTHTHLHPYIQYVCAYKYIHIYRYMFFYMYSRLFSAFSALFADLLLLLKYTKA